MKFCRAWPESCKQSQDPETQISAEVFPKDLVETQVRERLQSQIDRVVHEVVDDDPKPPKVAAAAEPKPKKKRRAPKTKEPRSETRDLWLVLIGVSIVFFLLFGTLYSKIAVLEKVIFESRV